MDALTIPKIAPEACTDHRPAPELCLLAAVIQLALRDLQKRRHRAGAQAFIASDDFEVFCEWVGWDADTLRNSAAREIAGRHLHHV